MKSRITHVRLENYPRYSRSSLHPFHDVINPDVESLTGSADLHRQTIQVIFFYMFHQDISPLFCSSVRVWCKQTLRCAFQGFGRIQAGKAAEAHRVHMAERSGTMGGKFAGHALQIKPDGDAIQVKPEPFARYGTHFVSYPLCQLFFKFLIVICAFSSAP